jgi:hypothetical protein
MYSMIQSTESAQAASPERPRRRGGGVGGSSPAGTHVPFSTWYLSPPGFMYALVQPSLGQRYARSRGPSIARLAGRRRARGAGEGERSATGDTQRGDAVGAGEADAGGVVGMSESEADESEEEDESGDGAEADGDAAGSVGSSKSMRRNALTSTSASHAAGGGGGRTIPHARGSGCAASKCARSACSDGSARPQHAKLEHCAQRQRGARGMNEGAHEGLLECVRVGGGRVGRAARERQAWDACACMRRAHLHAPGHASSGASSGKMAASMVVVGAAQAAGARTHG